MAEQESAAPAPAPAKKSKKGLIITLAVCLILIVTGGMLAMKFLSAPQAGEKAVHSKEAGTLSKIKSLMNLEPFLVNLADAEAPCFVKVTFRLGLDEESIGEEYGNNPVILSAVRDRIISLLSVKNADEILTQEGKDKLRTEMKEKLNPIFPKGKIIEVFILDFVVQL